MVNFRKFTKFIFWVVKSLISLLVQTEAKILEQCTIQPIFFHTYLQSLRFSMFNTMHLMSDPEGNSQFCFLESSDVSLDFVSGNIRTRGKKKTNWFPEGPDIKCFVIYLAFHFSSNKRITGVNQSSRLGTYNNTNLILKTTE